MPADSTTMSDYEQALAALEDIPREPGAKKPDAILVADGVRRSFGGLVAVDVDHLEVQRGVITSIIGPNGAGKTTLFNLLTGFDKADTGTWAFEGNDIARKFPHQVSRLGMVRTFQLTKALSRLTVLENMRLGGRGQMGERLPVAVLPILILGTLLGLGLWLLGGLWWIFALLGLLLGMPTALLWRGQERRATEKADALLKRFKLDHLREEFGASMSGGQRKLLEMARSLMTDPVLVMLDEPMAGVNPALRQSLLGHMQGLRDEGMTVLFIEHDMDVIRHVSDWVCVMAQGKVVAEGPPDHVMANPAVIDAYLGAHHDAPLTIEEEERVLAEIEAETGERRIAESEPSADIFADEQPREEGEDK